MHIRSSPHRPPPGSAVSTPLIIALRVCALYAVEKV